MIKQVDLSYQWHTPNYKKSLLDIKSNACSSDTQQLNSTARTHFLTKKVIFIFVKYFSPVLVSFKKAVMCPWTTRARRLKIWRARACVYNRPLGIYNFFENFNPSSALIMAIRIWLKKIGNSYTHQADIKRI